MTERTKGLAVAGEALAASAAICVAAVALVAGWGERTALGIVAAVALVWSAVPSLLPLLSRRRVSAAVGGDEEAPEGAVADPVTVVIRLGDEPIEVAAAAIRAAASWAPTVVLTTGRVVPLDLLRGGVSVHRGASMERALEVALPRIETPAVLLTSSRAVALEEGCRRAAALLGSEMGWVTGESVAVNDDSYAPMSRWERSRALRQEARAAGADLWEPDATLVRTDLLRGTTIESARPWGSWLRRWRTEGRRGVHTGEVISLRAVPVGASGFWPEASGRQRALVADLSGAVRSGAMRSRFAALALLAWELHGVRLLLWLPAFQAVAAQGGFSRRIGAITAVAVPAALATLRWWCERRRSGARPRPMDDLLSSIYHAPASVGSVASLVSGRLRRSKPVVATRPLVWVALLLTVATGVGLLDRPAGPILASTAVLTLGMLGALWMLALRALLQRDWERVAFRVPLEGTVVVDGTEARLWDASPDGIGIEGDLPERLREPGSEVEVRIAPEDGEAVCGRATVVASRRSPRGGRVVGLELDLDDRENARWLSDLFSPRVAERRTRSRRPAVRPTGGAPTGWRERLVGTVVVLVSAPVAAALVLVLLGLQPLVVRSGSMRPSIQIGDVVLSRAVDPASVRPGDVVTIRGGDLAEDSVTHRVVSVEVGDDHALIQTRGDANAVGERWTLPRDVHVGRSVGRIPWVGRPAVWVRGDAVRTAAVAAAGLVLAVALLRRRRSAGEEGPDPGADGTGSVAGHEADDLPQPELLDVPARDGRGGPPRGRRGGGAVPEGAARP